MSLEIKFNSFKSILGSHFRSFFIDYDNPANPYYINYLDTNGELKSETAIRAEADQKMREFVEDISTDIYNFVKEAQVDPGQAVSVDSGSHIGTSIGPGTVS